MQEQQRFELEEVAEVVLDVRPPDEKVREQRRVVRERGILHRELVGPAEVPGGLTDGVAFQALLAGTYQVAHRLPPDLATLEVERDRLVELGKPIGCRGPRTPGP